jgi:hypothetical protein
MTPKLIEFFPFHGAIMWSRLVKIQYTELKLSFGNDPVVKTLWKGKNPIYFGVIKSKVKVTVTINIIVDNRVVSA